MKKSKSIMIFGISSIVIVIFLVLLVGYRYSYGVWNPFVPPDRIQCNDRRYYISKSAPETLIGEAKPAYTVDSQNIVNTLTGRHLFSSSPKGTNVATEIFLEVGPDQYQSYTLSGGP